MNSRYEKTLDTPVQYLKGVGPKLAKLLAKLEIKTIEDLIYYFPRDYIDRKNLKKIDQIGPSPLEILKAEVSETKFQNLRGRNSILKATLSDRTGSIQSVWFNQPYLAKLIRRGMRLIVTGKVELNPYEQTLQLSVRDFEIDTGSNPQIAPVYSLTEGLFGKKMRAICSQAIEDYLLLVSDILPENIRKSHKLPDLLKSIKNLHYPIDLSQIEKYRYRIIFDDFFFFQLGLGLRRDIVKIEKGIGFRVDWVPESKTLGSQKVDGTEAFSLRFQLPFELTGAQKRVLEDVKGDMQSPRPMNRLIQGDVGSGKTIIAAIAARIAVLNGYQVAIMAPTEILANQHYYKISAYLKDFKVKLITGTTQRKKKGQDQDEAKDQVIIGTHALIEEDVTFPKLGLVIIDEQHRFGVLQRAKLAKKGTNPDILFLTATPIPRSLALTLYGDLDRSVIDEMPPGRTPVKTHYVTQKKRNNAYEFIREKVKEGRQVFVVCPLVQESEKVDLKAAMDEAENLRAVFPEFRIGLLHGRMKGDDKDRIMRDFKNNVIQILVSTTVIEVGIDIPNATIMVVEHAERFGLSQLHQLRGRIGRGAHESFCFLFSEPKTDEAKTRIKAMLDSNDGFYIAEVDLKLRGPGDFAGVRQSGLPNFRLADIIRDEKILRIARKAAFDLVSSDPLLQKPENQLLKKEIKRRYGKFLGY